MKIPTLTSLTARLVSLACAAALASPGLAQSTLDELAREGKPIVRPLPPPREEDFRTAEIVVTLRPDALPAAVAVSHGLAWTHASRVDTRIHVFGAPSVSAALLAESRLSEDPRVVFAHNNLRATYAKDQFVPNDPFYGPNNPAAPWPGQWYLRNQVAGGTVDINVAPAWTRGLTGQTGPTSFVSIGVIDDGIEWPHADLQARFDGTLSFDFGQNDTSPLPVYSDDNHGTAVSGLVAAFGGNGLGVTGVAPRARFGMMRLDFGGFGTASQEADAIRFRAIPSDFRIRVKNMSYGPTLPFAQGAVQVAALRDASAAGTIFVRSAGNARGAITEDANKQAERNIPEVITVAAIGSDGAFADYSNFGANVFVCAPSAVDGGLVVITTDRTGETRGYNGAGDSFPDTNYTSIFGGTSTAAPLVAGVMALGVQAQPALNPRFAKHLLARTSRVVDPNDSSASSDGGWKTNAAGFRHNQNYGFGLIDADAFTLAAPEWAGVTPLQTWSTGLVTVGAAIPDNVSTGVTRTFSTTQTTPLEEVRVTLTLTHAYRGDLEAFLTSPRGTRSRLFGFAGADGGANITDFTFTSNAFWGENPQGAWQLNVRDVFAPDAGSWTSYNVTLRMGTLVPLSTTINGRAEIDGHTDLNGRNVTLWLRDPGTQTIRDTLTATLNALGDFSVTTTRSGTFDIVARGPSTLQRKLTNVVVTGASITGVNFTGPKALVPGDIEPNNAVDVDDFLALAATYETNPLTDPRADLNGDGAANIDDFLLLAAVYETIGED